MKQFILSRHINRKQRIDASKLPKDGAAVKRTLIFKHFVSNYKVLLCIISIACLFLYLLFNIKKLTINKFYFQKMLVKIMSVSFSFRFLETS